MTYCVGVKLEEGLIFASDSRTHAGVDNYAKFCKMTVFERAGDRVLVLLSAGGAGGHPGGDQHATPDLDVQRGEPGGRRDAATLSAAMGRISKVGDWCPIAWPS